MCNFPLLRQELEPQRLTAPPFGAPAEQLTDRVTETSYAVCEKKGVFSEVFLLYVLVKPCLHFRSQIFQTELNISNIRPASLSGLAIACRLEAIAIRLEAITVRLEAIACGLEAITMRLEAIAFRLEAIAVRLEAIACKFGGHC